MLVDTIQRGSVYSSSSPFVSYIYLQAGTVYQFDAMGVDGGNNGTLSDPYLRLYSPSGALVSYNDDGGVSLNSRIFYTPAISGNYSMSVTSASYGTGSFDLIVNASPVTGSVLIGESRNGLIDFNGDIDLYSVSLTAGVSYSFSMNGTTLVDPYLELLDSYGEVVTSDDDSGSGINSLITYTPTASGTYYLGAREYGNDAVGTYSINVWQTPTVSIGNATVTESNSGAVNLTFTLTLSNVSPDRVSVDIATYSSTATAGLDYLGRNTTVTFAPNQTTASFTVSILGDDLFEPTEIFRTQISNPSGASLGTSIGYGYILDNDSPFASGPTDPYLGYQWYLYPTTGINVFPVWQEYSGQGVRVAVFDQGIDSTHPDLRGNLLTNFGRNASNLGVGGSPIYSTDNHGTMVAGVIAAQMNGIGIVGVAFDAGLVSIYSPLTFASMNSGIVNAYSYAANFDVINDSWGYANGFTSGVTWAFYDNFLSPNFSAAGAALANLASTGRDGLGTVVVQSAGNSFTVGDDTNLHNFQNSQFIITVAATDYFGDATSYSSPGASILIAAPGGGGADPISNILTTDRVGASGNSANNYIYTAGTSFSAPLVSGIIALMLEANPNLGYRDVQEILAYSARKISNTSNTWEYNGASNWNGGGLHYDSLTHNLGFGLVDATAAVHLAKTWSSVPNTFANRVQIQSTHSVNVQIPDASPLSGAFDSIYVSQNMDIERVEVTLNVTHSFIGDLSVLLISPSGTSSFLMWRPQQNALSAFGSSQDDIHFTFDTVLNWGENSYGSWGLYIADNASGDFGTFDSWTLNIIGKSDSNNDTYVYTDEYSSVYRDSTARGILSDSSGIDAINCAACSSSVYLDLSSGSISTVAGSPFLIDANTVIENAFGGDSSDTILGNSITNYLEGMRGNDTIDGGAGIDTAVFTGASSSYALTLGASNSTVADSTANRDGTDTLTNVERLRFTDRNIALDVKEGEYAGMAYRMYKAALNREPDWQGLGDWIAVLDKGYDRITVLAAGFTGSDEFKNTYGTLSNGEFVNLLYNNVLGRGPDPDGFNAWVSAIEQRGASRELVLFGFSESVENVQYSTGLLGQGMPYIEHLG